ncbi:MAG: hypothetical protein V4564_07830 [Pseudomonadota bacterium]
MPGYIDLEVIPATILSGAALSAEVDIGSKQLVGIAMPAAWTTAVITLQASLDGGATWLELVNTTGAVSYTVAAGQFLALDPATLRGVNAIKVRSGTSGLAVNQGADRIVGLAVRSLIA